MIYFNPNALNSHYCKAEYKVFAFGFATGGGNFACLPSYMANSK
jgi:hypothetical protein